MKSVAIIGAGPAGLMAAERLASLGHAVTIHDAMPSPGRKFLLAGRGGLNLTHSEPLEHFLPRYREARAQLEPIIGAFPPQELQEWSASLDEATFVGSSGRVFPKSFKASPLLRAWLRRLDAQGVTLNAGWRWTGFDGTEALCFATKGSERLIRADATILALGGASWPRLGSTGAWTTILEQRGIAISPLRPANCGFEINWSGHLRERHSGEPLKRIAITFDGETVRGEAMLTTEGLEGGAVYALSGPVRDRAIRTGTAVISLDLRPDIQADALAVRLASSRKGDSLGNRLRKQAGLSAAAIAVLRDATPDLSTLDATGLAAAIKAARLHVTGVRPIDRAISSAGGVRWSEVDDGLMLRKLPGVFVAGEMLDWEAPTGGYLLQACFATGVAAAMGASRWLAR